MLVLFWIKLLVLVKIYYGVKNLIKINLCLVILDEKFELVNFKILFVKVEVIKVKRVNIVFIFYVDMC